MKNAIEMHNLVKKYGKQVVLNKINLHIPKKAIYGFIGINGAGKTTTFGVLNGFFPYNSGSFTIHGSISAFPQDTRLYSGISVEKQFRFLCALSGIPKNKIENEMDRVLTSVNMGQYRKKRPERLSHGMNKRLSIAQSFIGNPDILLLDEPIAGLDPQNAFEIKNLIKKLGQDKTIVISSHALSEIAELCHNVGLIHNGIMQFEGSLEELTQSQSIINVKVTKAPNIEHLRTIKHIHTVEFDSARKIVTVHFDVKAVKTEVVIQHIVETLYQDSVGIIEITLGEKLEDSFLKMVK